MTQRVLIVEDNLINQEVASAILDDLGLETELASNGIEALKALQNTPESSAFKLILMDCQMPEMDGYETTRNIRGGNAGEQYRSIPILALTANAMRGDRERCIEAGMNDHIAKPINNEELSEKIHHLLAQSDTSPEVSGNDAAGIADDRSIWDKEKLLQRLRGREELVNKLCKIFYEQTDKHAAELDQLEQHFDLEDAVYITHSIKGGAANLSFLKLAEIAKKAEVAAREQDSETCKATVPEIRAALIQAKDMVSRQLEQ